MSDAAAPRPPITDAAELYLMAAEMLHHNTSAQMGLTPEELGYLQQLQGSLWARMPESDRKRVEATMGRWPDP